MGAPSLGVIDLCTFLSAGPNNSTQHTNEMYRIILFDYFFFSFLFRIFLIIRFKYIMNHWSL